MTRVSIRCPHCQERFRRPESNHKKITCPHCDERFAAADATPEVNGTGRNHKRAKKSNALLLWCGIAGALVVILAVVLILVLRRGGTPEAVAKTPEPPPVKAPPSAPPTPKEEPTPEPKKEPEPVKEAKPVEPPPPPPVEEPKEPKVKVPEFVVEPPTPKIPGVSREKIALAIERGIAFLKARQLASGTWPAKEHELGYAALAGLALVECGVPVTDPAVARAAGFVRGTAAKSEHTYDLSLAVLFLDRLEQPADRVLIQALALRIAAGQNDKGGWDYKCPHLGAPQLHSLLTHLQHQRPKTAFQVAVRDDLLKYVGQNKQSGQSPGRDASDQDPSQPAWAKQQDANQKDATQAPDTRGTQPGSEESQEPPPEKKSDRVTPEKSLAEARPAEAEAFKLSKPKRAEWMLERGMAKETPAPPKPPLARAKPRSELLVGKKAAGPAPRLDLLPPVVRDIPAAGGTGKAAKITRDDNSNTQFALLALWAARRHDVGGERALQFAGWRFRATQNKDYGWGYQIAKESSHPMSCVGLLGLAMSIATAPEMPKVKDVAADGRPILDDAQVLGAFKYIGPAIAHPAKDLAEVHMKSAYLLWSIERMAMLYGLNKIDGKDWYGWGAQILIKHQNADGSWKGGGYHGSNETIDTCFALLFLRRSNLAHEFTDTLQRHLALPE